MYSLQFGFQQKFSATLINLIESIRRTLDKRGFVYCIFENFLHIFDNIDQKNLTSQNRILRNPRQKS